MNSFIDHAPVIGLLFFFGVFVWIAVRTYRPGQKQRLQQHAHIPLNEDHHER